MLKLRPHLAALLLLAGAAAGPALAAQDQSANPLRDSYDNVYRILHLDLHAAELLAWKQCPERERCRVTATLSDTGKALAVRADAATHARLVEALAREDAAPRTQVFQLHLFEGSPTAAAAPAAELPPGARKAFEDLRGFLPYKSYRLLDTAWLPTTSTVSARLIGDGGASYEAELRFRRVGDLEAQQLFVDGFRLREESDSPALKSAGGERRAPRQLLNTSFALAIGETIVVGTSRVDGAGDKALVVLLTAVAEATP